MKNNECFARARRISRTIPGIFFSAVLFFATNTDLFAAPEWLSGQSKRYPPDAFLLGVGSGVTIDAARDSARAEIAKIFRVSVEQTTVETATERSGGTSGGPAGTIFTVGVEQRTSAVVSDTVEGSEIVQVWYDKKAKIYWALAVMDKAKYRRELSAKAVAAEEKVMRSLERARDTDSHAEKLKNLSEARQAAVGRDAVYARRRVVDDMPPAPGPDDLSVGSIESEIIAAKAGAVFKFVPAEGISAGLAEELSARLTRLGFAVADSKKSASAPPPPPSLEVDSRFAVEPFSRGGAQSSWKYYRWEGRVEVKDSGKVIIAVAASGSESNPDEGVAGKKARLAGLKILGDLFERKIKSDFLGGE